MCVLGYIFYSLFICRLETYCREDLKMKVIFANPKYSTDNALMIANTGIRRIEANLPFQNGLFLETKPEWPLTDLLV